MTIILIMTFLFSECEITECNRFCHKIGRTVGLCVFGKCICQ
nr:unnamed protein product [Callosobruchus chinensis]